jgi:hypothetical protein
VNCGAGPVGSRHGVVLSQYGPWILSRR